ncbi:hypothetical protein Afil01_16780 [Actinorhabdospora filicis]|uniref:Gram-positive cocci surface proteins LPxTG domain-containing protein n=1 Tax=Actinorhabdospora filicis TaxID=1785913 RepID=A0A9W6SLN5_9ACTN|nr:hypothetical protein [Actinorhabdospora filicis]GLZ76871.1 hypothetical protein Afil01_16780 [Actinorhabdospora filicis]
MSQRLLGRALVRSLLGVTALAAGVLTLTPAASAADKLDLKPEISDVYFQRGTTTYEEQSLSVVIAPKSVNATVNAKITVDLAAFGGKLTLKGNGCTGAGTVYTCVKAVKFAAPGPTRIRMTGLMFTATEDAVPANRDVTWKLTTDRSDPAEISQEIVIADKGTLYGDGDRKLSAKAGDTITFPDRMRNAGGTDVRNPSLRYALPLTFDPVTRPSNCRYQVNGRDHRVYVDCYFDTTVTAGKAYRLSSPVAVKVGADTPVTGEFASYYFGYTWLPSDTAKLAAAGEQGDGPALTLVPTDGAPTSTSAGGNLNVAMSGQEHRDLAISATPIKGKVGDKITVTFTATNVGKTAIINQTASTVAAGLAYGVPAGLKAADCSLIDLFGSVDQPLKGLCGIQNEVYVLRPGQTMAWTVVYTVEKAVAGASAKATFYNRDFEGSNIRTWSDENAANDSVVLKPEITGKGSATGPLAKTGLSMPAAAGTAGLLVTAGGAALVLARRRRA